MVALSLPIIGFGVIYSHILIAVGVLVTILGLFGWSMEPSVAPKDDYEPPAPSDDAIKELTA